MFTYCLKEYLDIRYRIVKSPGKVTEEALQFAECFSMEISGRISPDNRMVTRHYLRMYIRDKYAEQIDNLVECDLTGNFNKINKLEEKDFSEAQFNEVSDVELDDKTRTEMKHMANEAYKANKDEYVGFEAMSENSSLLYDDTCERYAILRSVVLKYIDAVITNGRGAEKVKSINAFIDKHSLLVDKETVIALIDTTVSGNGKKGFLFTTHAIYQKVSNKEVLVIPYADVFIEQCKLGDHKKGNPKKLHISLLNKKGNVTIDTDSIDIEALLDMLIVIGKLPEHEIAPTDSPQNILKMDYSAQQPFVKYMVNFMQYSKRSVAEVLRFACEIGFTDSQLLELTEYIDGENDPDGSLLIQVNDKSPYGSRKSLRYALLTEMFNILHFTKQSTDISSLEHEFIRKTARMFGFSDEDIANLKEITQAQYKILVGQIKTTKELSAVATALSALTVSGAVPTVTVLGSSALAAKSAWMVFIPGIGTILAVALAPVSIVYAVIMHNQKTRQLKNQIKEMVESEKTDYKKAINRLLHLFPERQYAADLEHNAKLIKYES